MKLSLNEIQVTARKAALGAGLPLGLAEEAGAAAYWLAASGFPVAQVLAAGFEGVTFARPRLERSGMMWSLTGDSGVFSAFVVAPSVCDLVVAAAKHGNPVAVRAVLDVPLLAIAQGAVSSERSGLPLAVAIGTEACAVCHGQDVSFRNGMAVLPRYRSKEVRVSLWNETDREAIRKPGTAARARASALEVGVLVDRECWERVQALAARTLVPATRQSRERGAGAGIIDTD